MVDSQLLHKIKSLGNDYKNGDEIVRMLDYYGVHGLIELSREQMESYYNRRIKNGGKDELRRNT